MNAFERMGLPFLKGHSDIGVSFNRLNPNRHVRGQIEIGLVWDKTNVENPHLSSQGSAE